VLFDLGVKDVVVLREMLFGCVEMWVFIASFVVGDVFVV